MAFDCQHLCLKPEKDVFGMFKDGAYSVLRWLNDILICHLQKGNIEIGFLRHKEEIERVVARHMSTTLKGVIEATSQYLVHFFGKIIYGSVMDRLVIEVKTCLIVAFEELEYMFVNQSHTYILS